MKNTFNSFALFVLSVASLILLFALSGCSVITPSANAQSIKPKVALGNAELHTHELANELFAAMRPDRNYRFAVAGFVPVDTFKPNAEHQGPLMLLGQQLEQGLITEAVKRGFIATDYKAANSITITENSDRILTRDIAQLNPVQRVDFFITGTITHQQQGAVVNARVINARTKDVVAAATKFFPGDIFWQTEQVTTRGGKLYRIENPSDGATL
ncbi:MULTISPECIES: FlgO family outer membrane protein [Alteromonadaceae]|uniref:FlgO family outer membrane protein n=1 Tax=Brumicola blandensis TaxID=3075611 RepID=A0AAW8R1D0_9ALTE|nr:MULTISPECIES: FlgO family outer membrane protein [unclassified Alteromonas]MDT0581905.1 FlgO family outer membrane protein [Alteromonas sp. W409]MDT0628417.1 FlgO family outer membrane protein [Alteromonas sp. W364]